MLPLKRRQHPGFLALLGLGSLAIWGAIVMQVLEAVDPPAADIPQSANPMISPGDSLPRNAADGEFLKNPQAVRNPFAPLRRSPKRRPPKASPLPVKKPPQMRFEGFIADPREQLVLVTLAGGETRICRRGDVIEGVEIVTISGNTIEARFQGRPFRLTLGHRE